MIVRFEFFRPGLAGILISLLPLSSSFAQESGPDRNSIAVEALKRLKGVDLESNPAIKAAVLKVLQSTQGTPHFVEIVRDFQVPDMEPELLQFAQNNPAKPAGVDAVRMVLAGGKVDLIAKALNEAPPDAAGTLAQQLGQTADRAAVPLLLPLLQNAERDPALRRNAVRALAMTQEGAAALLELAREGEFPPDLQLTAAADLNHARWPEIKREAEQLFPLPQTQNAEPLPAISELITRKGDPVRGAEVYGRPDIACINCHQVHGRGNDFGPNLSEIGTKLGKDALYEAILNPSGGIAFGYEGWEIELANGDEIFGIIISETADELAVKNPSGIVIRIPQSEIEHRRQVTSSVMPAGLQAAMTTQDLVDLVEYLASLKKR
jgi:putative heme-binding domain-containing protein